MPMTTSQAPVAPVMNFEALCGAFMTVPYAPGPWKPYPVERVCPPSGDCKSGITRSELTEVAMSDNRASNGNLGAILGALIAAALAIFLLNGGEHFGKKTVN